MTASVENNNALTGLDNRTSKAGQHGRAERSGHGAEQAGAAPQAGTGDDRVSLAAAALQRADHLEPPRLSLHSAEQAQEAVARLTEQLGSEPSAALRAHTGKLGQDLAALLHRT